MDTSGRWIVPSHYRWDSICPRCGLGRLAYDGLLNLMCVHCGYVLVGACT